MTMIGHKLNQVNSTWFSVLDLSSVVLCTIRLTIHRIKDHNNVMIFDRTGARYGVGGSVSAKNGISLQITHQIEAAQII